MTNEVLWEKLQKLESEVVQLPDCSPMAVQIPAGKLLPFLEHLKVTEGLKFVQLLDHTAIDWPEENEFELVYQLYSLAQDCFLAVHSRIPRNEPYAPTMSRLWAIAEWQEREVYDLFGVLYEGHPDLRRLFLEDDWVGFPLRKDYKDDFMLELPK
ncbi:MAG: NADH-quinone oxidoreductase subunit C [Bdellovibrionaceae bacterium]|nr:NADH-quinone oxidoreductase subunit C [Bdellovibrionales bacterium]MCB9083798.1 NADH-quinone oxidoreductase subunit C [Pseudobdellovibrionaceae bacterium]